jgi:multidrug efflux system membrane fusion protein
VSPARIGLLLIIIAALAACSDDGAKKKADPPPVPVSTARALTRDVPVTLQVVGRAEAYESVVLKSRVDGQVAAVLFTEGQHVNQGDVLIRLDPKDFAARLQQAEANAARDQALVAKTRADTSRYAALKDRNFVSEEKVNDIRTNEAAASASLQASKAAVELARLQLSYATIRAPFAGVVGARLVFPGSSVKINDTTLGVVNRVRPLLVSFSVPEKYLPRLRSAMASASGKTGGMKVEVSLPGDTTQHLEGEVRFIDNAVDTASGTIQMKAVLPNADEKLTPGQFLDVSLLLDTLAKTVTVPNEAVQQGVEGNFVFVVKDDSSVEVRKVVTAASAGGLTAISTGVQADETVVTDGQLRLAPGVRVKARETGPTSPANSPVNADTPATSATK